MNGHQRITTPEAVSAANRKLFAAGTEGAKRRLHATEQQKAPERKHSSGCAGEQVEVRRWAI